MIYILFACFIVAIHNLCVVNQNFQRPSLIPGSTSKFDFRESGQATFNPSMLWFCVMTDKRTNINDSSVTFATVNSHFSFKCCLDWRGGVKRVFCTCWWKWRDYQDWFNCPNKGFEVLERVHGGQVETRSSHKQGEKIHINPFETVKLQNRKKEWIKG